MVLYFIIHIIDYHPLDGIDLLRHIVKTSNKNEQLNVLYIVDIYARGVRVDGRRYVVDAIDRRIGFTINFPMDYYTIYINYIYIYIYVN